MTPQDFDFLCNLLKTQSGLVLTQDKTYLLESRLNPVARRFGVSGLPGLVQDLRVGSNKAMLEEVVDAMTTNESFFFRDIKPFDQFRDSVLPHLLEARQSTRSIRIWSAACSSGQEPYSLAMLLREQGAKLSGWRVEIVGTDLSAEMLRKARAGIYSQFEVQRGLPIQYLVKYFKQDGDKWEIDSALRAMVKYQPFNLLNDLAPLGRFDVVFCRNVLIYFDQPSKSMVLERISKLMPEDGYLYLGGAETVLGVTDRFVPRQGMRGVYGLTDANQPAQMAV